MLGSVSHLAVIVNSCWTTNSIPVCRPVSRQYDKRPICGRLRAIPGCPTSAVRSYRSEHSNGDWLPPPVGRSLKEGRDQDYFRSLSRLTSFSYGSRMNVAGFDLNLLKAFDALYAERHVTRAGQRIGLSQSAMSGALTRLREVFDDELFVRSPTGMLPTPRADDIAGPISSSLQLMQSVLQDDGFDPALADHIVTIAMTDYAAFVLLPPLLARLAVEAPRLELRIRGIFGKDEVVDLLDSGEASLALSVPVDTSARIMTRLLLREGFACIARPGHPAFAKDADIETFAAAPHLLVSPEGDRTGVVDRKLAVLGLTRRVVLSLPQFLVAPFVVAETDLIATLASRVAKRFAAASLGIVVHEPPIAVSDFSLAMMWHRRVDDHPATVWLRDCIARIAASA